MLNCFFFCYFPYPGAVEELITLIENVADSVSMGQCNPDSMSMLLANLRIHGPQLEDYSKSTLDQGKYCRSKLLTFYSSKRIHILFCSIPFSAYVKFRNASQDERLSIITRMNLLELIELRAKSWQISDGINTYYKHKASDVQVRDALTRFLAAKHQIIIGFHLGFHAARIDHICCYEWYNVVGHLPPSKYNAATKSFISGRTY